MRILAVLSLAALLCACSFQPVSHDDANVNCANGLYSTVCHKLAANEAPKRKTNVTGY